MSYPLPGIVVTPSTASCTVTFTDSNGATPTVYSDSGGVNTISLPDTSSAAKTYYMPGPGTYTVSCKDGSTELAGGTVQLLGSEVASVDVTRPTATLTAQTPRVKWEVTTSGITGSVPNPTRNLIIVDHTAGVSYNTDTMAAGPFVIAAGGIVAGPLQAVAQGQIPTQLRLFSSCVFVSNAAGTQSMDVTHTGAGTLLTPGTVVTLTTSNSGIDVQVGADLTFDASGNIKSTAGGVFWIYASLTVDF